MFKTLCTIITNINSIFPPIFYFSIASHVCHPIHTQTSSSHRNNYKFHTQSHSHASVPISSFQQKDHFRNFIDPLPVTIQPIKISHVLSARGGHPLLERLVLPGPGPPTEHIAAAFGPTQQQHRVEGLQNDHLLLLPAELLHFGAAGTHTARRHFWDFFKKLIIEKILNI